MHMQRIHVVVGTVGSETTESLYPAQQESLATTYLT